MAGTVDLSAAWKRVTDLPPIRLADADLLAREFGLEVSGPDADGLVHAEIADRRTGARHAMTLGKASSAAARAWLAWRERRDG